MQERRHIYWFRQLTWSFSIRSAPSIGWPLKDLSSFTFSGRKKLPRSFSTRSLNSCCKSEENETYHRLQQHANATFKFLQFTGELHSLPQDNMEQFLWTLDYGKFWVWKLVFKLKRMMNFHEYPIAVLAIALTPPRNYPRALSSSCHYCPHVHYNDSAHCLY